MEAYFYLFINFVRIYITFRFINIFLPIYRKSKYVYGGFGIYFLLNSMGYLVFQNEVVNRITNLGCLLMLVILFFNGTLLKKFLSIIAVYVLNYISENIAWVLFVKDRQEEMLEFGFFFAVLMLLCLELLVERTVTISLSSPADISIVKEVAMLIVVIGSAYISTVLIEGCYNYKTSLIISLILLLIINIALVYLYEKMLKDQARKKDNELARIQLAMYEKQLSIMQSANEKYKILRHDITNHMLLLSDYINNGDVERAGAYLKGLDYFRESNQYINTGNYCIDCIVNYVKDEIERIGGVLKCDILVPETLEILDCDLNVILSNLLLNACEAIQKIEDKVVELTVKFDRGVLTIGVKNKFDGIIEKEGTTFLSRKRQREDHGIGLLSVSNVVEKYHGEIDISHIDYAFNVVVILFCE